MDLYIAMQDEEQILAIVLADSCEKASIAFYAMGHTPESIESIQTDSTDMGIGGVVFVANTVIHESRLGEKTRYMKRGL